MAMRLAEGRFRLEMLQIDEALDPHLRLRRHQQVDGPRAHDADWRAREATGDSRSRSCAPRRRASRASG